MLVYNNCLQSVGRIVKVSLTHLTLYLPMAPSYRNQSVDLQSKSADWFLYDENIGR